MSTTSTNGVPVALNFTAEQTAYMTNIADRLALTVTVVSALGLAYSLGKCCVSSHTGACQPFSIVGIILSNRRASLARAHAMASDKSA